MNAREALTKSAEMALCYGAKPLANELLALRDALPQEPAPPSSDWVPLGTISECPSCGGDGKLMMNSPSVALSACWRCGGSGRVMAYKELPAQFKERMGKVSAFVDAVQNDTGNQRYLPGLEVARKLLESNGFEKSALVIARQIDTLAVPISESAAQGTAKVPEGEIWHFMRSTLEQGAAVHMDYHAGKYPTYEHYAARIDTAARERGEQLQALLAAAPSSGNNSEAEGKRG